MKKVLITIAIVILIIIFNLLLLSCGIEKGTFAPQKPEPIISGGGITVLIVIFILVMIPVIVILWKRMFK